MTTFVMNRVRSSTSVSSVLHGIRSYAKVATGSDIISAASNVSLQKARNWDEGVSSKFSTTPINDIFKVAPLHFFSLFRFNFQYPFIIFVQLLMGSLFFFNLML